MKMYHPETKNTAECPGEEALLFWEQLGWEKTDDDAVTTMERNEQAANPQQFTPIHPDKLAAAAHKDAEARAGAVVPPTPAQKPRSAPSSPSASGQS